MTAPITVYPGNSGYVEVLGLQNFPPDLPPAFVNNASLVATLYSGCDNQPVPGFIAITGAYVAGSPGDYTFTFDGSVFNPPLSPPGVPTYSLVITGTGAGASYRAVIPVIVAESDGTET